MNIDHLLLGCLRQNLWCIFKKYDFKDVYQTFLKLHITLSIISKYYEYYCSLLVYFSKVTNFWKREVLKDSRHLWETSRSAVWREWSFWRLWARPADTWEHFNSDNWWYLWYLSGHICKLEKQQRQTCGSVCFLPHWQHLRWHLMCLLVYAMTWVPKISILLWKWRLLSSHVQRAVVVLQSGIEVDG